MQQITVPVLAGIGNAVMAVPLVRALGRLPGTRVTVLARTRAIGECFDGLPEVAECLVLPAGWPGAWRMHRTLAHRRPEALVVPFPSNRWQYALLAATSGARHVVMHDYPVGGLRSLRFIPRALKRVTLLPAERGVHDVRQNLRLAEALGATAETLDAVEHPIFPIFPLADADRRLLVGPHDPGRRFIAIQPGCGDTLVGRVKRWPVERFAALADALADRGQDVVVIEGPDERGLGRQVSALSATRPRVVELTGPLKRAAALLERASLYVGNDSGLAHVAAAVGTPAVTLFAAADPARVAPFGCEHLVVTPRTVNGREWKPRLLYPMDATRPKLREDGIDWAMHIDVADVLASVERALAHHLAGPQHASRKVAADTIA